MNKILVRGAVIVPITDGEPKFFTGSVAWEGDRIVLVECSGAAGSGERSGASVDRWLAQNPDTEVVDGAGKLLMPGLINTHTHAAMTLVRGAADDIPLMEWLEKAIWPFEARLTAEDIARGAEIGFTEMLRGGTTTLVDMYWHEASIARVAHRMGIRAVLCPSFVEGPRMADFERDLVDTLAFAASAPELLSVRIAPHAAYSCSEANLRRAVELAHKYNIGITTHVSETLDEQRLIRERHGCTPTEYLNRLGLFDVPTIAAHCVHVTEDDMDILIAKGVTVAHNPQSNMKLASGAAPVARMVEKGVNVALGTDGAASNNDLDMFDEMRTAALLGKLTAGDPSVLPAWEVLRMATVNGARALGMAGQCSHEGSGTAGVSGTGRGSVGGGVRLGEIAVGATADLAMLDISAPHWRPHNNLVNALVYSAKSSDVVATWVGGSLRI